MIGSDQCKMCHRCAHMHPGLEFYVHAVPSCRGLVCRECYNSRSGKQMSCPSCQNLVSIEGDGQLKSLYHAAWEDEKVEIDHKIRRELIDSCKTLKQSDFSSTDDYQYYVAKFETCVIELTQEKDEMARRKIIDSFTEETKTMRDKQTFRDGIESKHKQTKRLKREKDEEMMIKRAKDISKRYEENIKALFIQKKSTPRIDDYVNVSIEKELAGTHIQETENAQTRSIRPTSQLTAGPVTGRNDKASHMIQQYLKGKTPSMKLPEMRRMSFSSAATTSTTGFSAKPHKRRVSGNRSVLSSAAGKAKRSVRFARSAVEVKKEEEVKPAAPVVTQSELERMDMALDDEFE
ncbi:hypothetical protein ADUPG1_013337 [Aduncisulcus paluster]|uniref:MAT1 centre domain-containing protein n=1 Tax=Aduncisulcus paluster TaxID=2918883 RepID=A0ABQ5K2L0_9EUKA|nr:hypothetical protein ADUPG1_013337 [Aduncisulcus paluster]